MFYVKLYVHSLVEELKWFYENARCYNKIFIILFRIFCLVFLGDLLRFLLHAN